MNSKTNTATSLFATASPSPGDLTDTELLTATRSLVGRSNQLLGALLAHLGEVEARGIHRTRACSSLYTYCIYELRFSEDEAFRRVAAARLVRRFPALWDAVASGELHLTGLLMLGPHLTQENLGEVLLRAKHRTKKEIARLVRQLDPLPEVPPRIEPLGPAPARAVTHAPTWEEFARSLCPVRNLSPGDRPRDWMENANDTEAAAPGGLMLADTEAESTSAAASGRAPLVEGSNQTPRAKSPVLSPQRYKVQFTAGEEYVKLVEEARALLSHSAPRAGLHEIQLRAMRLLVAELKRQKRAATARPRKAHHATPQKPEHETKVSPNGPRGADNPRQRGRQRDSEHPRRRGRHIPAAVRRAVFERDEGRCTYVDSAGRRCAETHRVELHHLTAFAQGGEHTEANLTVRCRAHNALAAEEDFGRERIERARDASEHEPWARQPAPDEGQSFTIAVGSDARSGPVAGRAASP
jgi:hypothetical protein